jgi:hypothetical protein
MQVVPILGTERPESAQALQSQVGSNSKERQQANQLNLKSESHLTVLHPNKRESHVGPGSQEFPRPKPLIWKLESRSEDLQLHNQFEI